MSVKETESGVTLNLCAHVTKQVCMSSCTLSCLIHVCVSGYSVCMCSDSVSYMMRHFSDFSRLHHKEEVETKQTGGYPGSEAEQPSRHHFHHRALHLMLQK